MVAKTIVIQSRAAPVFSVRPLGDLGPKALFSIVERVFNAFIDDIPPIFGEQGVHALLRQITRPEHGGHIAPQDIGNARVGQDPVEHVLTQDALIEEFDRRNTQGFLPNIFGLGIIPTSDRPAKIGHVSADRGEQHRLTVKEDGFHHRPVGVMRAAVIRVVQHDDVAFVQIVLKRFHQGFN